VLTDSWGPPPHVVGLRDGLLALGYRENEDFELGVRFTQGDVTALPAAAHQLMQYGVDLIFATGSDAAQAAQRATTHIPIVFAGASDPVELGLVKSFARPGGNITGVTDLRLTLGPKRLQIFQDLVPRLKRVLFPYDVNHTLSVVAARVYRDAAHHLGIMLVEKPVRTEEEARTILAQVQRGEVDGILTPSSVSLNIPGFVLETTAQKAIPTMFNGMFYVEQGGLASYGPDYYDTGKQAARLVGKIFKGTAVTEIPVESNAKLIFAVNLQTAQALGLTIAPEVLYQADHVFR
jgi:putative ABC transport system substrate-binding protein